MVFVVPRLRAVALLLVASGSAFAGENVWTSSGPPGDVFTLAIDPVTLSLYAGSRLSTARTVAFRSSDRGASWVESGEAPASSYLTALAVSPTTPTTVYASVNFYPSSARVYRSSDEGMTWLGTGLSSQMNVWSFAFRSELPPTVYAAGRTCYCAGFPCFYRYDCFATVLESNDSGLTWSTLASRMGGRMVTAIALDPLDENRIYAAGDGGVFVSADRGARWYASSSGLEVCSSVRSFAVGPSDGTLLIATANIVANGYPCGGLFRSSDGARTWTPIGPPTQIATSVAFDPTNPRVMYVGTTSGGGVFRSDDAGSSWSRLGSIPGAPNVSQIVVEPSGMIIHAATSDGVFDYEIVPGARPPVTLRRDRGTRTVPTRP